MVLSDEHVDKFKQLYKKHFGKDISKQDAYDQGIKLVRLLSIIYKPITEDELAFIEKRKNVKINHDSLHT